ncbi:MAG: hypothetical protein WB460_19250 [Candidatus Acidiferrales bacterium]
MKRIALFVLIISLTSLAHGQTPTLTQCKTTADMLMAVTSDSQFSHLTASMTAGDELELSTKLAQCQDAYAKQLTPKQFDKTDRMMYKLDADVINRMYGFMERHHLTDKFNDEEEARRKK